MVREHDHARTLGEHVAGGVHIPSRVVLTPLRFDGDVSFGKNSATPLHGFGKPGAEARASLAGEWVGDLRDQREILSWCNRSRFLANRRRKLVLTPDFNTYVES
jgi:hypothetical protein